MDLMETGACQAGPGATEGGPMDQPFVQAVCDSRHNAIDRRLDGVEKAVLTISEKLDKLVASLASTTIWATVGKLFTGAVIGGAVTIAARHMLGG